MCFLVYQVKRNIIHFTATCFSSPRSKPIPDQEAAWQDLKKRLVTMPLLAYPDPQKPYFLYADAYGVGIVALLMQVQDGMERRIAYGSSTLTKEERRC